MALFVVLLLAVPAVLLADPISYVPLVATALLTLVSFVYLQILRRSLSVDVSQMSESCERGESSPLAVTLANSFALPFPRIEIDFFVTDLFGENDDVRTFSSALGGRETRTVNFDVTFAHLGTYYAGVSRVVVHDLLGLFSSTRVHGARRPVVVRPRHVDMGDADATRALPDEKRSSLRPVAADDVDYASVREYRYGDPLKTVHWNLSARSADGTLYTRLFEAYVNPTLAVIIDPYAPDWGGDDLMCLFDGIVEVAVALSEQARIGGVEAEVLFFDRDGELARMRLVSAEDADDLVSRMMRITPASEVEGQIGSVEDLVRSSVLRNHGFGNVALVSSRTDAGALSALSEAVRRRRNALAFLAVPRLLEGRERDSFVAPLRGFADSGGAYYLVESNELSTEVIGL